MTEKAFTKVVQYLELFYLFYSKWLAYLQTKFVAGSDYYYSSAAVLLRRSWLVDLDLWVECLADYSSSSSPSSIEERPGGGGGLRDEVVADFEDCCPRHSHRWREGSIGRAGCKMREDPASPSSASA